MLKRVLYSIVAAFVVLVGGLALYTAWPVRATQDERMLLRLVTAMADRDGKCLPFMTDTEIFGGTYGFGQEDAKYGWLDPIYDVAKGRVVRLIVRSGEGISIKRSIFGIGDRRCQQDMRIATPIIRGEIAFVDFRYMRIGNLPTAFHGTYAFRRKGSGWRYVAYRMNSPGIVI